MVCQFTFLANSQGAFCRNKSQSQFPARNTGKLWPACTYVSGFSVITSLQRPPYGDTIFQGCCLCHVVRKKCHEFFGTMNTWTVDHIIQIHAHIDKIGHENQAQWSHGQRNKEIKNIKTQAKFDKKKVFFGTLIGDLKLFIEDNGHALFHPSIWLHRFPNT